MGCHSLLQGTFPSQGANPLSCIIGRFFTVWAIGKTLPLSDFLNFSCFWSCFFLVYLPNCCQKEMPPRTCSRFCQGSAAPATVGLYTLSAEERTGLTHRRLRTNPPKRENLTFILKLQRNFDSLISILMCILTKIILLNYLSLRKKECSPGRCTTLSSKKRPWGNNSQLLSRAPLTDLLLEILQINASFYIDIWWSIYFLFNHVYYICCLVAKLCLTLL